jgi:hypothetical protein
MIFTGSQSQLDQRAGIRDRLVLPSIVLLVAAHGLFARLIPLAARFALEIVLTDEGFLDGLSALGIDFLLSANFLLAPFGRSSTGLCGAGFRGSGL